MAAGSLRLNPLGHLCGNHFPRGIIPGWCSFLVSSGRPFTEHQPLDTAMVLMNSMAVGGLHSGVGKPTPSPTASLCSFL